MNKNIISKIKNKLLTTRSQIHIFKNFHFLSIMIIFILGFFVRVYDISKSSYWLDEGFTVNAILNIINTGSLQLKSGFVYDCAMYCYPTSLIVRIFGESELSFRILSTIFGTLIIFLFYYYLRKIFDQKVALLTSFLIAFSSIHIAWSQDARWYTEFAFFFWLAVFSYYKALEDKTLKYIVLTTLFTCFAIFTHKLALLLPFIFILHLLITKRIKVFQFLFIAVSIIGLDYITGLRFIASILNAFDFSFVLPFYTNYYLITYLPFVILSIYGFFVNQKSREFCSLMLIILTIYFLSLGLLNNDVFYRYMFHLTPVMFILSSVTLAHVLDKLKNLSSKFFVATFISLLYLISPYSLNISRKSSDNRFLESDSKYTKMFSSDKHYYSYTPEPDWRKAYLYISGNLKSDEIVISSAPVMSKIYLGYPGLGLPLKHLGSGIQSEITKDDKDIYTNATIIKDLNELKKIQSDSDGYLILDYMASNGRIDSEILEYIKSNMELVLSEERNQFSKIWIYKF